MAVELYLRIAAILIGGFLLSVLFLSAWLAYAITHPKRRMPGEELKLLEGLRSRTVEFRSLDQKRLQGLLLEGPAGDPRAIVLCHGIGAYKENLLGMGRLLNLAGYTVLLFDFRGHGLSEGDSVSVGPKEAQDVRGAVRFLQGQGFRRFGIFGLSMGAAAAAYAGPEIQHLEGMVLDSCPASLERIMLHLRKRHRVMSRLGGRLALWFIGRFSGVPARSVRPIDQMDRLQSPLLFIHGDQDRLIDPGDLELLYERAREPKEKLLIAGAGHGETFRKGGEAYREAVLRFFAKHLPPTEPVPAND